MPAAKKWMPIDDAVRRVLVDLVKSSELSQREIARRTDISEGRLRQLLSAATAPATFGEGFAIAGELDVSPQQLVLRATVLRESDPEANG